MVVYFWTATKHRSRGVLPRPGDFSDQSQQLRNLIVTLQGVAEGQPDVDLSWRPVGPIHGIPITAFWSRLYRNSRPSENTVMNHGLLAQCRQSRAEQFPFTMRQQKALSRAAPADRLLCKHQNPI